ncbi:MAG: C25 family cysteine peptidase [Dethiobacteria bacterium]|nr:C25 family cysteine peptidase [Dethiobacteria bacterium]
MIEVYLLNTEQWLKSLTVASAALSGSDREVCFVDPQQFDQEIEQLSLLASRLPARFINTTGSDKIAAALTTAGIESSSDQAILNYDWQQLVEMFGLPKGICTAPAGSAVDCLKAAAMAVRLGYYFLPLKSADELFSTVPGDLPLVWCGDKLKLTDAVGTAAADGFLTLSNDSEALACLSAAGCPVDYLVILNSADLFRETERGDCLGQLWVKGLSLNALTLASYRHAYIFDAADANPDPRLIEQQVNKMVKDNALKLRFQAVLASPAVVPFFYEEKKAIGAVTEEMIRDIHIRLNGDIFFDLSEGRLMQNTTCGVSTQLISTKRYDQIQERSERSGREVLIVSTPHVDTGIIFSTDEALMATQILPLYEEAGYAVNLLQNKDAHYKKVSAALAGTTFFLYSGHGGPEGLHTHGRTLNRDDLPPLPPLVAYTSACSTVALVPHWYSKTEGLDWQGVAVDSRQVIGLSFVEKGALCFVGGATIEDLQYTTSTYSVFMEALLIKGLSVGEAIRELRNVISLYAAMLLQKNPEAYRKYRWGTANGIHQQVLLGDPAFVPNAKKYSDAAMPRSVEGQGSLQQLKIEIPDNRWRRKKAAMNPKDPSKYYYRCRNVEVITPYGEDVFSWGDYYRVAPDADNMSEVAVKSGFLHLTFDLPAGLMARSLKLVGAELGKGECLLCGSAVEPALAPVEALQKFKLPYLLQPPLELNMEEGWAFSNEMRGDCVRLHWLAPLLLIDEHKRSAVPLKSLTFEIASEPAKLVRGRINDNRGSHSYLVSAGEPYCDQKASDLKVQQKYFTDAALTNTNGSFELNCPAGLTLTAHEQFPLYELLEDYNPLYGKINMPDDGDEEIDIQLSAPEKQKMNGYLFDSGTGKPIAGALTRVFRGDKDPVGDILIEAHVGETVSGAGGEFSFELPAGSYYLYAAAKVNGLFYKSGEWNLKLREGEDLSQVFSLDQAALVRGKVVFQGSVPPDPVVVGLKKYPKVEGEGALVRVPVDRDGRFECLVSFQHRFSISIEEEGWQAIHDTNGDQGYKLAAQEVLERDYLFVPGEED